MIAIEEAHAAMVYKAEFEKLPPHCHQPHGWTSTHSFFANMGGFVICSSTESSNPNITHLTSDSLLRIVQHNTRCIDFDSFPSQEEILDRSKSDNFTRSLVVLHIVWFVANCITRLVKGLPTTQLEMGIMGTAVCSLISYSMISQKPHAVKTATVVLTYKGDTPNHIANIIASDGKIRDGRGRIKNL